MPLAFAIMTGVGLVFEDLWVTNYV